MGQDWIPLWMTYELEMFSCWFSHDFADSLILWHWKLFISKNIENIFQTLIIYPILREYG